MNNKKKGYKNTNKKKQGKIDENDVYKVVNKNNLRNRGIDPVQYEDERDYDDYEDYDEYEDYENSKDYDDYDDYEDDNDDYAADEKEKKIELIIPSRRQSEYQMSSKKKSPIKKFFIIVFSILFMYIAVFGGFIAYTYLDDDPENDYFKNENIVSSIGNAISGKKEEVPEKITMLLLGVDEDNSRDGTRTDTIMVACFDTINKKLSLISIPRDTRVQVPEDRYEVMRENIPNLNTNKVKINSIYSYGGEQGMDFLERQIEELLDIKIDYYAKINFKGFVSLIDSIGGVDYNVKKRCYYNDKMGLVIDLYPGEQHLDGEKAIQLVRFRTGYARADLERVEVQRDFLKAFLKQALSKEKVMSNPKAYVDTVTEYVETDVTLSDIPMLISAAEGFDGSNFKGYTLPGEDEYKNGVSYYIYDETEIKKMIDEVYNDKTNEEIPQKVKESSKDKRIVVLNGGRTSGLAKKASNALKEKGFNVISYDNSKETVNESKIYVRKDGQGEDLSEFLTSSEIIVDSDKCQNQNCDILIVLGVNEKLTEVQNG